MVAQMLHESGIPMGIDYDPADAIGYSNHEDYEIADILGRRDWEAFSAAVSARNSAHRTWGWKWPGTLDVIDEVIPRLRSPHVIAVLRDPVAIFGHEQVVGTETIGRLMYAARQVVLLCDFVERCPCPIVAVSYERAKEQPGLLQSSITAFLSHA